MPIYGYACKECGHELDALQKIADAPLLDCPACGAAALKRQLSAPRFRLKGQGWYETDFKKDKQRNIAGDAEPAKTGEAASAGKPDEKAATAEKSAADKPAAEKPAATKPVSDKKSKNGAAKKAAGNSAASD
jgi:putative FmdB family regulatory protein